jgi:hypothetical protein
MKTVQDYLQGKIYRIQCNITGDNYYGSTKQKNLSRRLSQHRVYSNKMSTSYDIIKRGDYQIILVETYPCKTKYELESRERYYIENNDCVNKIIPIRTAKERYEYTKEYYEKNKDEILERHKGYYEKNKDEISEKRKEKYTCECGSTLTIHHKVRHEKTQKHINFIKNKKLK